MCTFSAQRESLCYTVVRVSLLCSLACVCGGADKTTEGNVTGQRLIELSFTLYLNVLNVDATLVSIEKWLHAASHKADVCHLTHMLNEGQ